MQEKINLQLYQIFGLSCASVQPDKNIPMRFHQCTYSQLLLSKYIKIQTRQAGLACANPEGGWGILFLAILVRIPWKNMQSSQASIQYCWAIDDPLLVIFLINQNKYINKQIKKKRCQSWVGPLWQSFLDPQMFGSTESKYTGSSRVTRHIKSNMIPLDIVVEEYNCRYTRMLFRNSMARGLIKTFSTWLKKNPHKFDSSRPSQQFFGYFWVETVLSTGT